MTYTTPTENITNIKNFRFTFHNGHVRYAEGTSVSDAWRNIGYGEVAIELLKEWKEIPLKSEITFINPKIEKQLLTKQKTK